ncbi:ribosomal protein S6 [Pycnococcus provasolii]
MVSYHLLMVFKPSLARQQVASVVQQAGRRVFAGGSAESATAPGIVTAVRSHGHRQLAFEVKRHGERYTHGYIMAMEFCAPPEAIPDVRKDLKTVNIHTRASLYFNSSYCDILCFFNKVPYLTDEVGGDEEMFFYTKNCPRHPAVSRQLTTPCKENRSGPRNPIIFCKF